MMMMMVILVMMVIMVIMIMTKMTDDDDGDMMGEVWTTCWPTSGPASQLLASELRYHLSLEQNDNRIKHYEGHYEVIHSVQQ